MAGQAEGLVMTRDRQADITAFLDQCGWADARRLRVAGDASNRTYDRLTRTDGTSTILMDAPPNTGEDVRPFIAIADHLRSGGLSAPKIYHRDEAAGLLLIEDFGDALFADLMAQDPDQEIPLYQAAANVLLNLRDMPPPELTPCDADWLIDMLQPLFDWYAKGAEPDQIKAFKDGFRPLAIQAGTAPKITMLRDYHVQNLLLLPDRRGVRQVGILDFQDAMLAHPAYDLVSILQDARRDVSADVEQQIIGYYLSHSLIDADDFIACYAILGLQRNLRILGIFVRLCLHSGKAGYVDFIPRVWGYVMRNLAHPALSPLAPSLGAILPEPTPEFLEHLKRQCPRNATPS